MVDDGNDRNRVRPGRVDGRAQDQRWPIVKHVRLVVYRVDVRVTSGRGIDAAGQLLLRDAINLYARRLDQKADVLRAGGSRRDEVRSVHGVRVTCGDGVVIDLRGEGLQGRQVGDLFVAEDIRVAHHIAD